MQVILKMITLYLIMLIPSTFLEVYAFSDSICSLNKAEEYLSILYEPPKQCAEGTEFHSWNFSIYSTLKTRFSIDPEVRNYVRKVSNALFSVVEPTPLSNINLVAVSDEALVDILNLSPNVKHDPMFAKFVAGNWLHPQGVYLAHRYGGHQVTFYRI